MCRFKKVGGTCGTHNETYLLSVVLSWFQQRGPDFVNDLGGERAAFQEEVSQILILVCGSGQRPVW